MLIRIADIVISIITLIALFPFFLLISIAIALESKGGVFYKQLRVGIRGKEFGLFKFRSMFIDTDKHSLLTIGTNDSRITKVGNFIRKFKIDELPQLFNVLRGNMSIVGPRPEVRKYTNLYTDEQKFILTVKPGITDYASLEFINENEILGNCIDPERLYIEEILPKKIKSNKRYIENRTINEYFKIIFLTILKIAKVD